MSSNLIAEHASYLSDCHKLERYRTALQRAVLPGSSVLDLGSGTGLLGFMAIRAGAGEVFAVDHGGMAGFVREIVHQNDLGDRVVVVRSSSTDLQVDDRVDLIVGDQLGGVGYDAGVNKYYADAARRLLRPGGVAIPSAYTICFAPAEVSDLANEWRVWDEPVEGIDFSPMRSYVVNNVWSNRFGPEVLLGPVEPAITLSTCDDAPFRCTATLTVTRGGTMHGILGCFRAAMAPGVTMTNDPSDPARMVNRWQNIYPIEHAQAVEPGDRVELTFKASPTTFAVQWTATVTFADGRAPVTSRHASALGEFISAEDLKPRS